MGQHSNGSIGRKVRASTETWRRHQEFPIWLLAHEESTRHCHYDGRVAIEANGGLGIYTGFNTDNHYTGIGTAYIMRASLRELYKGKPWRMAVFENDPEIYKSLEKALFPVSKSLLLIEGDHNDPVGWQAVAEHIRAGGFQHPGGLLNHDPYGTERPTAMFEFFTTEFPTVDLMIHAAIANFKRNGNGDTFFKHICSIPKDWLVIYHPHPFGGQWVPSTDSGSQWMMIFMTDDYLTAIGMIEILSVKLPGLVLMDDDALAHLEKLCWTRHPHRRQGKEK